MGDCEHLNEIKFPVSAKNLGDTHTRVLRKLDGGSPATRLKTAAIRSASLKPHKSEITPIG